MRFFGNRTVKTFILLLTLCTTLTVIIMFLMATVKIKTNDDTTQQVMQKTDRHRVVISSNAGQRIVFDVELADTPIKSAKGLMFRTHLPQNQGMIFISEKDQVWSMWMKNTLIGLDMVYFNRTGDIVKIIKNAIPQDESILSSDFPVAGVLEVGGGITDKYNINVGDNISSPVIK